MVKKSQIMTPSTPSEPHAGDVYQAVIQILMLWRLTDPEMSDILGISVQQFASWRTSPPAFSSLSHDVQYRISHILAIYAAPQTLFRMPADADEWLRRPNDDVLFAGQRPLDTILLDRDDGLRAVDQYLKLWVNN